MILSYFAGFALTVALNGIAEEKQPAVVVIGAGLAGLTTAYRLQQKGIAVHVYEARNRVGGRIFTVRLGDR
ncbi:FAD-dependent oxidoreductase, partial [bacterium]|nr:FAD-dependent oxidoreductase [bacterium]